MIKSVGSVFENSIIADYTFGHLFNMCPFLEPAANMIYRRNLYVNVSTTGAGACGSCEGPEKAACQAKCPPCDKHHGGFQPPTWLQPHRLAGVSEGVLGALQRAVRGPAIPGQPMPPVPAGNLDTTINANTGHVLPQSARLSGRADYQFELGPPPGWPALSVNDTVIKEWDFNLYYGVERYEGAKGGQSAPQWDAHALHGEDPLLQRSAESVAAPWNRTCEDYAPGKVLLRLGSGSDRSMRRTLG